MRYWYAVMKDNEDTDWGTGSFDLEEAKEMLRSFEYEEGFINVIDGGYDENGDSTTDPICIDRIWV